MKIDEKLRQEERDLARLRDIRKTRIDRIEDLRDGIDGAERLIVRKRERRREIRDDELFRPHWTEAQRDERREQLADESRRPRQSSTPTSCAWSRTRTCSSRSATRPSATPIASSACASESAGSSPSARDG